jgi:hypothetical protein
LGLFEGYGHAVLLLNCALFSYCLARSRWETVNGSRPSPAAPE